MVSFNYRHGEIVQGRFFQGLVIFYEYCLSSTDLLFRFFRGLRFPCPDSLIVHTIGRVTVIWKVIRGSQVGSDSGLEDRGSIWDKGRLFSVLPLCPDYLKLLSSLLSSCCSGMWLHLSRKSRMRVAAQCISLRHSTVFIADTVYLACPVQGGSHPCFLASLPTGFLLIFELGSLILR